MRRLLSSALNRLAMVAPGGATVRPLLHRWRGAAIGVNVWIGLYVYIDDLHPELLSIGDNCTDRHSDFHHYAFLLGTAAADDARQCAHRQRRVHRTALRHPAECHHWRGSGHPGRGRCYAQRPARTLWGGPPAAALGAVTVPLTATHGYIGFLQGLRPLE